MIKNFKFKNFEESQKFVNKVGNIAEEENHHPDIVFGWGYCKIKIFTHAIKGLAESDFILAAKIDKNKLVIKVSNTSEKHFNFCFISSIYNFLISDGSTRLNYSLYSGFY